MQVIPAYHQEMHRWWLRSAERLKSPPCTQIHYKHTLGKITHVSTAAFTEPRYYIRNNKCQLLAQIMVAFVVNIAIHSS